MSFAPTKPPRNRAQKQPGTNDGGDVNGSGDSDDGDGGTDQEGQEEKAAKEAVVDASVEHAHVDELLDRRWRRHRLTAVGANEAAAARAQARRRIALRVCVA